MERRKRRSSRRPLPEEERRRLHEAYWRSELSPGPELLARLGRALGRGYETLVQFPFEGTPSPIPAFSLAGDDPAWDGPFLWARNRLIGSVRCRLLIRPPDEGPLIAVACRRRYLRGDPPVDVDMLEEEMSCAFQPWEVEPLDGTPKPIKPSDAPPEPAPLQYMLEFCAASATHSGQPVLVSWEFSKVQGTRAIRALGVSKLSRRGL